MKLIDKINSRPTSRPFFSLEFFPPKTEQGFANLNARIQRLLQLHPLAVSVTWGAGGSTKDRSLDLAAECQKHKAETILHLTCTNVERGNVQTVLKAAKDAGVQNILALRGDPPRGAEYWIPTDPQFNFAIDLVAAIRSSPEFSQHFCIGVAAYPDGHPDHDVSEAQELEHLKQKIDAGADWIFTQLFYDVDAFFEWERKVRAKGITVPIIPCVMPIQSYPSFLRVVKLAGSKVPESVHKALEPIRHDDAKVKEYGVDLATSMIQRLTDSGRVPGVHFCTLNLELSVRKILERLQWTLVSPKPPVNKLIVDSPGPVTEPEAHLLITPGGAARGLTVHPQADTSSSGKGEVNDPSTWDEYPNGRFGDSKSPAYGAVEPWDSTLAASHADAIAKWGNPRTEADLTALFLAHLDGRIEGTPFWDTPLSPESRLILPHLRRMTARGWWTVGSQPAADAVPSDDTVFGWGPVNGYVFQKAFVEFFASREDVDWLERSAKSTGTVVTYFAGNADGEWATNMLDESGNAVTWGVFPGQEIAQSTIIERDSFLAWKEEAFRIWAEWSQFYPPNSPERVLLEQMRQDRWLISIVHHDFKDADGLWKFWLDGREQVNGL